MLFLVLCPFPEQFLPVPYTELGRQVCAVTRWSQTKVLCCGNVVEGGPSFWCSTDNPLSLLRLQAGSGDTPSSARAANIAKSHLVNLASQQPLLMSFYELFFPLLLKAETNSKAFSKCHCFPPLLELPVLL